MRRLLTLLALVMTMIFQMAVTSCEKEEEVKKEPDIPVKVWKIYVYGRPTCGFCNALKNELDGESIPYSFYDIDTDADKKSEMWSKLNAAGMGGGSVNLPVVDVEVDAVSHMFTRPSLNDDIKPLIE